MPHFTINESRALRALDRAALARDLVDLQAREMLSTADYARLGRLARILGVAL